MHDFYEAQAHIEMGIVLLQACLEAASPDPTLPNQAANHFRQARTVVPNSGVAALGLALALLAGGDGGPVAAEPILRHAMRGTDGDVPHWHLQVALARLLLQRGIDTQWHELYGGGARRSY